jgi:hypothetical protein
VLKAHLSPSIVCILEGATAATSDRGCDSARQRHHMHEVCAALLAIKRVAAASVHRYEIS